jgi:hypothetical protein
MPAIEKAARAEIRESGADAQLAKGRRRPVETKVSRYVDRRAPAVARKLAAILARHGKRVAAEAMTVCAELLAKDDAAFLARIAYIIEELSLDDLGVDIEGELTNSMLAAFKRAAALGLTEVGFDISDDITRQLDDAALAFGLSRGGELIKDLAGTTRSAMSELIGRAVEEGMSTNMLADAIRALGAFSESRAETIARTELAYAHVRGNVAGWRATGEVAGKRWLLADTHPAPDECDDAADAGIIDLDGEFPGGIDFPPAHPNCLCDVLPVLRELPNDSTTEGD